MMKSNHTTREKEIETRAADALTALLRQISAIELREMKFESEGGAGRAIDILARVGVYGQSHTLACKVTASCDPISVRKALRELCDGAAHLAGDATPVFIAPYLPPEAQALCREAKSGFLDFQDNARLMLGEAFIGKRSIGRRNLQSASALPPRSTESRELRAFPSARAEAPLAACQSAA